MRRRSQQHEHDNQTQNQHHSDTNTKTADVSSCSEKTVLFICLAFRIVNALFVQTYFNPDEHWQALEVAHRITFGYGHLTWEWNKGIRSYLHPLIFALLYKLLAFLRLDSPLFMIKSPRLLQSLFAAVGDLYLYKLSNVVFGSRVATWALFSQLTNWFMFFCFTRTFSNSLETVLTLVGLYYWPCMRYSHCKQLSVSRRLGLFVAALACAIRPTSAIIWVYVGILELFAARDRLRFIFLEAAPIGGVIPACSLFLSLYLYHWLVGALHHGYACDMSLNEYVRWFYNSDGLVLVLGVSCLLDRWMYGSWVLVPLNFLKFNFLSSGGDYYGTHKWHWYFTQGFTVMLFSFIPFTIAGIIKSRHWKLSGLVVWVLGLYSVLGHKEFRFVLPVLPVALMFSGYSLAAIEAPNSPQHKGEVSSKLRSKRHTKLPLAVFFLLVTNVPMAFYMSLVHQRGTEDVMSYLSKEAHEGKVRSILFLMPCHATPYYSTLHRNIPMRFLDCTPSEGRGVLDESDQFFSDPAGFTSEIMKNGSLPSHVVLFDSEASTLRDILISHSFKEVRRFFHAHFEVDRGRQAAVLLYGQ